MISRPADDKVNRGNTINFCYNMDWNPWGPRSPGGVGIVFIDAIGTTVMKVPNPGPNGLTVFCRVDSNQWMYLGQYRAERMEPLSGAEWATLPKEVLLYSPCLKFETDSYIQARKKWFDDFEKYTKLWAPTHDRLAKLLPRGNEDLEEYSYAKSHVAELAAKLGDENNERDEFETDELKGELKAARRKVAKIKATIFTHFNNLMCRGSQVRVQVTSTYSRCCQNSTWFTILS